jgi:hypothetical protein
VRGGMWPTAIVVLLALTFGVGGVAAAGRPTTDIVVAPTERGAAARQAIAAALALLPMVPKRIAVIDVSGAKPDVRERLVRLDAFTVSGNDVVYLVDGSELLRGAQHGFRFHRAAVAAVIWHEMAHLDGADEREARKAESRIWTSFVRDGFIDQTTGLRYLNALEKRPDDTLLARAGERRP